MKLFWLQLIILLTYFAPSAFAQGPQCSAVFSVEASITANYDSFKNKKIQLIKDTTALQHLQVLADYQKTFASAASDPQSPLFDGRFQEVIKKLMSGFTYQAQRLNQTDLDFMTSTPQRQNLFEGILYFQVMLEAPLRLLQHYGQFTATRGGNLDFATAPTSSKKIQHFLQSLYNGPLKYMFLIPSGIDLPGGLTPTQKIFKKLWQNPQYQPDHSEMKTLKEYKAELIFKERQDFLNEHRQWVKIRRMGDYAMNAVLALSMLEAFNWYEQLNDPEATVEVDHFLNQADYQLQDNEIRIYNETVPFPHMALEIDGLVYSYGQTHMTVKTAREYLMSEIITEGLQNKKNEAPNFLQQAINWTGLNHLERVVQTARIQLDKNTKEHLKHELELQTGKRYRNHTLAMDCSTMIVKALKQVGQSNVPALIDPSPSQVMFYLGSLKSLQIKNKSGQDLVTQILQVRIGNSDNKKNHLWRNLYINLMETKVYWSFFQYSLAQRTYLEFRYGKDQLQYWDSETLNYFKSWDQDIKQEFANQYLNGQLAIFQSSLQTDNPHLKKSLKLAMDAFFTIEEAKLKETLESLNSRFEDLYRANLNLILLMQTKQKMYQEAGFTQAPIAQ